MESEGRSSFSENRSAIQNMLESPKITFGGDAICKVDRQPAAAAQIAAKKAAAPAAVRSDDRAWVFDAINQYFDVIVEDEEEEEESDEEESSPMYETQVVTTTTTR